MELSLILLKQVVIMLILILVGYAMFRGKKISIEGSRTLGNILIYLSLPCVIINGFRVERTAENVKDLLICIVLAAVTLAVSILISRLFFLRKGHEDVIAAFASAFPNPGFFGIPLITAVLGSESVFYIAPFVAFLNMLQWTYGVSLLKGTKVSLHPKDLLKAPFMIAILIGLFFFFTGIHMPEILSSCITDIANLNTPLAMFTIGVYLAQTDIRAMLHRPKLLSITAVRMILIPLAALLILIPLPQSMIGIKLSILIAAGCPVGSNVAVYAHLHGHDYPYAVQTVIVSTLLSIALLPMIVMLAQVVYA